LGAKNYARWNSSVKAFDRRFQQSGAGFDVSEDSVLINQVIRIVKIPQPLKRPNAFRQNACARAAADESEMARVARASPPPIVSFESRPPLRVVLDINRDAFFVRAAAGRPRARYSAPLS
jgi:hypothetical protein